MIALRSRLARLRATLTRQHRTVWESLHEPRKVTLIMMGTYFAGFVLAMIIFTSIPGPLPEGVFSARLVAGVLLAVAGFLGVPGAWRGWWFLEQFAVISVMFAVGAIAVSTLFFVNVSGVSRAIGVFLAVMVELFMLTRWQRVSKSNYRADAGPLLPEHRTELTIARIAEAERAHE